MSAPNKIAKKLMDVIPPSMSWIRLEMRSIMDEELTIPQFRILGAIFRGNNVACDIAKNQGTSQAAISKMIDGLVSRGLVLRVANIDDRRHFHLNLTDSGKAYFKKTRKHAQENLKEKISCLDESDREDLARGLLALEKLFLSARSKDRQVDKNER
jgi:DNA-binding MarR family transcriptional regulator